MACQKTHRCVINDDATLIAEKVQCSDVLVLVSPIYYYEMSGQLKTMLDRMNPLYGGDYRFREKWLFVLWALEEQRARLDALAEIFHGKFRELAERAGD